MSEPDRTAADARIEHALRDVNSSLATAAPRERASLLKRAGDICVGLDEPRRALAWYGRAIDQLLELGEGTDAARLCRLIIFVQPNAVRARSTLTWIDLGTGRQDAAIEELRAYAQASRVAGQNALAADQLEAMFEVATLPALRERLVVEMRALGESARAEAMAVRLPQSPIPPSPEVLWATVLDATIGGRR